MPKGIRNPREDYPLGSESGGGMGGGGGGRMSMSAIADKADMLTRPKVINAVRPDIFNRGGQYAVRNIRGPEEIEAIKSSGYMLPKEGARQTQKHFTQTDNMGTKNAFGKNSVIRVPIGKVPSDRAVSRKDVEIYNRESGKFESLKKGGAIKMASGGKVSSASSRADGIAQRGKTKGRYL